MIKQEAIQNALDTGVDPDSIVIEEPIWEWTAPDCDPLIEDCSFGLEDAPEETGTVSSDDTNSS